MTNEQIDVDFNFYRSIMDDDDFYIDHYGAKMLFEAMMYAGGFRLECRRERRYSTSPELSPIRKRSISPDYRKGG